MTFEKRIVSPGKNQRTVIFDCGTVQTVPKGWDLLPPGDAGVTRRVKARGPSWTVKQKKGRRMFSLGVWAPAETIAKVKSEFAAERSTEAYAKRRKSEVKRREKKQEAYVSEFQDAVIQFLDFAERYRETERVLAKLVTRHATPVGSGTVARTQRIPVSRRAESAVIAWLRHQTTAYDNMSIPRIKGKRREVRRMLAEESRRLLEKYRRGQDVSVECPLQLALRKL